MELQFDCDNLGIQEKKAVQAKLYRKAARKKERKKDNQEGVLQ